MDPSKFKGTKDNSDDNSENSQYYYSSSNVSSTIGEIRIELDGSHITSTETENASGTNRKNVKFEDEPKEVDNAENLKEVKDTGKRGANAGEFIDKEENLNEVKIIKANNPLEVQQTVAGRMGANENTTALIAKKIKEFSLKQQEIQRVSGESKGLSNCFKKIIDIFERSANNLEHLEIWENSNALKEIPEVVDRKRKRVRREWMRDLPEFEVYEKRRSRSDDGAKEDVRSTDTNKKPIATERNAILETFNCTAFEELAHLILEEMPSRKIEEAKGAEGKKVTKVCTISTSTSSCEVKSLGCQTQLSDGASANELSLLEDSSLTSRYEQPNSLNNYAQADNACVSIYDSQEESTKQPSIQTTVIQQPLVSPPSNAQDRPNVITIEANSRPSSVDLRRPPFCHRLWELVADFCAATFLCLQVNRDCIFCLGFFAAFVVSASFLTAFFYHTLIVSPSMW